MKKILFGLMALVYLSSCNLQQTIMKGGCTTHEFTYYNPIESTDSAGFYVVCDNKTLAQKYPNLAGKILKSQAVKLSQAPLK